MFHTNPNPTFWRETCTFSSEPIKYMLHNISMSSSSATAIFTVTEIKKTRSEIVESVVDESLASNEYEGVEEKPVDCMSIVRLIHRLWKKIKVF